MPLYEYLCEAGHVTDNFAKVADRRNPVTCHCGLQAQLKISAVKTHLDGTDPGFPDAYDKWAKLHEKAGREPEKENLTHI